MWEAQSLRAGFRFRWRPRHGLRFLIVPHIGSKFEERMVRGLASGFDKIGHCAIALHRPLSDEDVHRACKKYRPDVLFEVNRVRRPSLPDNVRHIGWWQDPIIPADMSARLKENDIIYRVVENDDFALGSGIACKVSLLSIGVDEDRLSVSRCAPIDFSLCGFIPQPIAISEEVAAIIRDYYRPLRGEMQLKATTAAVLGRAKKLPPVVDLEAFVLNYCRFLDRQILINAILDISHSVELYGPHWETHPNFGSYHQGILSTQKALNSVFAKSRINLSNNVYGFSLNSRVLECMAVGGFVLTHASPADTKSGGLKTAFEPGTHYGEFTDGTLDYQARRWLKDEPARKRAGMNAATLVRQNHLWRHRAQQIVNDLD